MRGLARGTPPSIAIDTNIFYVARDEVRDTDGHITEFLRSDPGGETHLLLDKGGLIQEEYRFQIWKHLQDMGQEEFGTRQIVLHWMHKIFRGDGRKVIEVDVDKSGDLWVAIVSHVPKRERQDATFVYMAYAQGRTLITNDERDILKRRGKIESRVQEAGVPVSETEILSSEEAHQKWKTLQQGGASGGTGQD